MRKPTFLALLLCSLSLLAEVSVTKVEVKPRWPWSGLVDVTYTIEGGVGEYCSVTFTGHDKARDKAVKMKSMSGAGTTRFLLSSGTHTATWDAVKDVPGFHTPSFTVSVKATRADPNYLVVDLSGGPTANRYPVGYTTSPPDLGDSACRTTELWLRLIPKGKFTMGSPTDEKGRLDDETRHDVTLTQDYYVGVFECTQKQWEQVMGEGDRPSFFLNDKYYATRPVEQVTYGQIRGDLWPDERHIVAPDSFMGRLQAKTGLTFDLPTEAQWEHACRARTTKALNSDKDLSNKETDANVADVGRYLHNGGEGGKDNRDCGTDNGTNKVGSYNPNTLGLYDCHGNVCEWCLDWYEEDLGSSSATDPVGPDSNKKNQRVAKGGSWEQNAQRCRSAYRLNSAADEPDKRIGFRVAYIPNVKTYLVVDLSGGPAAEIYPHRYSELPPDLNDDACRTTELWLRRIPKGSFKMGSPNGETWREEDEAQHQVTLTGDYYIGLFECTQRQWKLVTGDRPSAFLNDKFYATRPVEMVSYNDIRGDSLEGGAGWPGHGHAVDSDSFMGKLRKRTGLQTFDLPTEAEWEYACRAGTDTALNSGKNLTDEGRCPNMAEVGRYWFNGGSSTSDDCTTDGGTAKVGSYRPNGWGLYDMHGNVYEWCLDWYGNYPPNAVTDPQGVSESSDRVFRGGSWCGAAHHCRSAIRYSSSPSDISPVLSNYGFRVAFRP